MNTNQIIKAFSNEPDFIGCFARNRLPRQTKRPAGLIVNTDRSSSYGTHWLAYYISAHGQTEFFDPLGNSIPDNEIMRFVVKNSGGGVITWNNIPFQSDASWKCGLFCIYYLKNRLQGRSVCEIYSSLSQNPDVNESVV